MGHHFLKFDFYSLIVVILVSSYSSVFCEEKVYLRSFESLGVLALAEKSIYESLKDYFDQGDENIRNERLTGYLEDYEKSSRRLTGEHGFENIIAGHPLLSSRMVYRYAVQLRELLTEQEIPEIARLELKSLENSIGLPNFSDVEDIWRAILRIVYVYDLKVSEFATGNILGTETGSGFRAKDCAQIGNFALEEKYFSQAVEWLEFAEYRVTREKDKTATYDSVHKLLIIAVDQHNQEFLNATLFQAKFFTDTIRTSSRFGRQTRRNFQYEIWKGRRLPNYNEISFWGLCSGDDFRTDEEKSKLFCWYERKSNPAWFINPLKIEQISLAPDVIQIYEFVGDQMGNKLITMALADLKKSEVSTGDGRRVILERSSLNTWLNESIHVELQPLARQIELITNLVVVPQESAEILQVASNSFGSHYSIHLDAGKDENYFNLKYGRRIATFMIYLTDVEKGGYTAFAQAGIATRPIRGSAVFWYNLKRNGEIDELTHHGGCPVILGNKWVANKWIRSFSQFLTKPCALDPNE